MNEVRNQQIFDKWIEGNDYKFLARDFHLSEETIKEICVKQIPAKFRGHPWASPKQYKNFREWLRSKNKPI